MVNIEQVISTANAVVSNGAKEHINSVVVKDQDIPYYNNGRARPVICTLKLDACRNFYKNSLKKDICEEVCPFGFTVAKKKFNTSTNHKGITVFSVVDYQKIENPPIGNLHRSIKKRKSEILTSLSNIKLDKAAQRKRQLYVEGVVETLLVGRIGLSIQAISHQFFTPLQGAMADVRNIENKEDVQESANRLSKNFKSLNMLATQIQLILSANQEFNRNMLRRVTVHKMIQEIIDQVESRATEKKLRLNHGFNNHFKTVEAIPSQMNIVFSNVISNAVKYSFTGRDNSPLSIDVNYDILDEFLCIDVQNEGCLITKEEIDKRLIFNLSYRGRDSVDRQRSGSGSGLYISEQILNTHGGKIDVECKQCGGNVASGTDRYRTNFKIYWPIIVNE